MLTDVKQEDEADYEVGSSRTRSSESSSSQVWTCYFSCKYSLWLFTQLDTSMKSIQMRWTHHHSSFLRVPLGGHKSAFPRLTLQNWWCGFLFWLFPLSFNGKRVYLTFLESERGLMLPPSGQSSSHLRRVSLKDVGPMVGAPWPSEG